MGVETGSILPHAPCLILEVLCRVRPRSHLEPFGLGSSQMSSPTFLVAVQSADVER